LFCPNSAPAKVTPRNARPTIGVELDELDTLEELEDFTLDDVLTTLLTELELTTLDLDELLVVATDEDVPAPTIP
jgi:hypothetical protein